LPGLFLLCGSLVLILYRAISRKESRNLNGLILMMSLALLLIYTVGEVAVGHGLEILVYWIAFLAALELLPDALFRHEDLR